MRAEEILSAVVAYGGDESGIKDRFCGNAELYALCLDEFMSGAYTEALREALAQMEYEKAFDAAHALKGLSGNLGLTPYYSAICTLVESLRAKDYTNVDAEYAAVEKQHQCIARLLANEAAPDGAPEDAAPADNPAASDASADGSPAPAPGATPAPAPKKRGGKKRELFIPAAVGVAVLAILTVFFLFRDILADYQQNATLESAGHLSEINYQLKEYIEDQVENDWLIAYTVRHCLTDYNSAGDGKKLLGLMRELCGLWEIDDIILYTENGFCIGSGGETKSNDLASDMLSEASARGEYMRIIDSDIAYTVPVETALNYNGSRVAAVSVIKSMEPFLDEMGFSSFDESAYVYLCADNGAVISKLTHDGAESAYNVLSLFNNSVVTTVTGREVSTAEMLSVTEPTTYIRGGDYVVFTPISTRQEVFRLAYFVPENIVNRTMSGFSQRVIKSSLLLVAVFSALGLIFVLYINSIRKKHYDTALLSRDHMFDLLVKNSQTAFALFELNAESPAYISSNSLSVVGCEHPILLNNEEGFMLKSGADETNAAFDAINETLKNWDGTGVYRSGFMENASASPPSYYEIQLMPVGGDSDEFIGVAQDVTLLYEREAFIKNALAMAEQASSAKTRFLSNMSHDIRTPMNAIVNMADFAIEDMARPEKLSEDLKTIRESSDHLLGLINDILDMSRIESGKTTIDAAPFDLRAELRRLKSIITPLCAEHGLTLISNFANVPETLLIGDQVKVSQILMNLLSNAVKFTKKHGAVRFTATELPSIREDYANIRFTVEDTGMGVSADFLPHIFEPFSREDVKRTSGIQGTGLGLSICHSYVTAMGGQIGCESIEGDGTTFTVDLFFERTDAAPPPQAEATAWDVTPFIGMRCLFCEDNATNQRIGKTILARLGFHVDLASDGLEGLTTFRKSPPGYYNVIYMDIQMPEMDGYEAAAAIRHCSHEQAKTVPIIAVSANVFIEDIEKAHIVGMDGHVGKPVTTAALANETKRVLNQKRGTAL